MLTCLWIGHMRLRHSHMLCGEPAPVCVNCGISLTVSQMLVECRCYGEARLAYHVNSTLSDMLGDDRHSISNILDFLNATGLAISI
jgi:hypothetical protein